MHSIRILPSARRDLDALDSDAFARVKEKILNLGNSPRPTGTVKLTSSEGYRIRIGDYRILYRIDDSQKTIFIYRVKHRKESYR